MKVKEAPMSSWPVQDAKARFSELLDASVEKGPQIVTRRGVETAVLVPIEEWRRLCLHGPCKTPKPVSANCWMLRSRRVLRSLRGGASKRLCWFQSRNGGGCKAEPTPVLRRCCSRLTLDSRT